VEDGGRHEETIAADFSNFMLLQQLDHNLSAKSDVIETVLVENLIDEVGPNEQLQRRKNGRRRHGQLV
jgi:hypothetical protein